MHTFHKHVFKALGSTNEIQIYSRPEDAPIITGRALAECRRIEAKYSRYRSDSVISRINQASGTAERVELDDETAALINYAAAAYQISDGLFDVTSGILSRLWNFREMIIPSDERVQETLSLVGWGLVEWQAPYIRLPYKGMEIDFGGIGKEYAVDRVATILSELGVRHGMVNFGGDLRIIGGHPDGKPWGIGITHPRLDSSVLATLGASEGAIATSGDYERYFEIDGVRYCHIINPQTGRPAQGVQAVTVFASACTVAGTAATTAILKGPKDGRNYLEELGCPFIFVRNEDSILTRGFTS